jgi:hypothetical protein
MNERIGKLAVEAGALWHHGDWNMPSCVYFGEKDLEKFAELIVQECAGIVKFTPTGVSHARIIEIIKEHFGVEE